MDLKSFIFLNFFCLFFLYFNPFVEGDAIYGLCANSECSAPISKGITILRYSSPDDSRISVEPNEEVQIYVKDYGPKKDLWGVVVRGTKGYISKNFIRETNLFKKELVPAYVEFKTSIMVTDSYTVSSHLHVSSHPHQPGVVSQTIQYTSDYNLRSSIPSSFQQQNNFIDSASQQQSFMNSVPNSFQQQQDFMNSASEQQNFMNSIPNSFQQQQDFMNSASEQQNFMNSVPNSFQPQQDFMNSLPNSFQQHQDFVNSASEQQNFMNSVPNNFQQQQNVMNLAPNSLQQDFVNSAPNSIYQESNSHRESQIYNSPYSINPSSNPELQPQIHQSSQVSNFPEHSSQFYVQSENVMNSYEMSGVQSQDISPSATYISGLHSPSHHLSNDIVKASLYESSASNVPNSFDSKNFNPNSVSASQSSQNSYQHSLYKQSQDIQSSHAQILYPSLLNGYTDDDYSKTLAMLSSRGFGGSDVFPSQETQIGQSNQNTEKNFDFNVAEFNSRSSQLHHSPIEVTNAAFHPSVDSTSFVNEDKLVNLANSQKFSDNTLHENINSVPFEKSNIISSDKVKEFAQNMINDNSNEDDDEELESFSEENTAIDFEEEEDEEDENSDNPSVDLIPKDIDSIEHQLNMHSLSSSQINLQSFEGISGDQNSKENSIHYSSLVNTLSSDHSTGIESEQLEISSNKIISDTSSPQENKFSGDVHSILKSSMVEGIQKTEVDNLNFFQSNLDETIEINLNTANPIISNTELNTEKRSPNTFSKDFPENLDKYKNDALTTESSIYKKEHTTPKVSNFLVENEKRPEVEQILSPLDIDGLGEDLTTYQGRNLKGEYGTTDDPISESEFNNDENNTHSDSYNSYGNWFDALKSVIDAILSWIPEPLYSTLMNLQKKGISPRVPVFTTLCGFTCIFLIIPLFYLKDRSKENRLSTLLAQAEKKAYTFSAANTVLEEKLENAQTEISNLQSSLAEENSCIKNLKIELENQAEDLENTKAELESCLEIIDALKEKENEYLTLMNDYEKEKEYYTEHKESLDKIMKEQESSIETLTIQLQENEDKMQELEKEKEQFLIMKTDYEDKLAQFDRNCNQLLQEAEVWNMRVKELTENINAEAAVKEELLASLKAKDEEIESLKEVVETFKVFDEIEDPEEQAKTKKEKLQSLLNSITITNQLKKEEEKGKVLDEQLQQEKNRILDMEVELLEAKSEIDKLKLNYNQALQDKAEAQTKLEVLTNYFKDKEIQLQRQLGAQEADRQKKEEDVNSAERRILLIEQENASYKSQVASMKQEMEETERTLRNQIAAQEKKAHENWIAARAAERNLENMKQEVTQLRQKLTLLEREQENWANAPRDEIIRPVPKRIPGVNEESGNQEPSERGIFPHLHDRLPLPPMMLPPDRPLPPLPPPPMSMFLPPPPPPMERHFRSQPWHMPPDHNIEYRTTPPEFMAGRESTPPRGRPQISDRDGAPNTSSPMTTDTRDSQNSTPPHLLPDFHDIPPQPGRPYFPPPVGRPRYPMHPPYRRDAGPEPKRLDNQNDSNSRGPPQPPPSEQWQHSRV